MGEKRFWATTYHVKYIYSVSSVRGWKGGGSRSTNVPPLPLLHHCITFTVDLSSNAFLLGYPRAQFIF